MPNRSDGTGRPPIPILELLRRVLLVGCSLAAVLAALYPVSVIRVGVPNFQQMRREHARTATAMRSAAAPATLPADQSSATAPGQSLEGFIEEQTAGRLYQTGEKRWIEFYQAIAMADEAKVSPLILYLGSGPALNYHYFRADDALLSPVLSQFQQRPVYVKVEGAGHLEVAPVQPREAVRHAPAWIVFPWRHLAPWLLAAGIAAYALPPWPKAGRNVLRYAVGRAVIVPDLAGTAVASLLFALPMLIVADKATAGFALLRVEGGWIWLTLGLWVLAALGLGCVFFGLWYASASMCIGENGIVATNLIRARRCRYDEISSVEPAVFSTPRWLSMAIYFASVVDSPRGRGVAAQGREAYGAALRMRDGREIRLILTNLVGVEGLLAELKRHGIAVSRDLVAMFGDEQYAQREPVMSIWRSRAAGLGAAAIAAGALVAIALTPAEPYHPRAQMPELSEEDVAAQEALLVRMKQLQTEMSGLLKRIDEAPVAQRSKLLEQYQDLAKKYEQLSREATGADSGGAAR